VVIILINKQKRYSLPEMTNHDGEYNNFSCRAQTWSVSCILEAIVDFE
jgi:glycogen debranching enzyme